MTHKFELTPSQFWDYSVARYGQKEVAPLCLDLQDNYGVNVNLLLFMCWCIEHQTVVNFFQFQTLKNGIADSEAQLHQHRSERRQAKTNCDDDTYNALKAQELLLERAQQKIIVEQAKQLELIFLPQGECEPAPMNASVVGFINAYGLRENKAARNKLARIVSQLRSKKHQ